MKIAAVLFWYILRISVGDRDGVELDFNPGGVGRSLTYKERKKEHFQNTEKTRRGGLRLAFVCLEGI